MDLRMLLKISVDSILANKMRSFLTMLGVIIGVCAVIVLVSIGQGTTASITESIESMGSNLVTVRIMGRGSTTTLTYNEAKTFADLDGVEACAPVVSGNGTIKYGNNEMESISLMGIDSDYKTVRNRTIGGGRDILSLDVNSRLKSAVLGVDVVDELFTEGTNPVGKTIQINGTNFTVIGVLDESGSSMGTDNDEVVLIPITTAQRFLNSSGVSTIYVSAENTEASTQVVTSIENELYEKFKEDDDAYRVSSQDDMLETVSDVTQTMSMMLGGIAGISLLVGGIGIMNIMLVSVTERTREIGIRKAIGARRKDILTQFIIEAAVVSGMGGIIGVIVGWGGCVLVTALAGVNTA
ncbi:MAG TPA: ABC transporter permease, partial [Syntrophomonas sp.]|nr:ABC transporter permease [Syntrophomonas sp.]